MNCREEYKMFSDGSVGYSHNQRKGDQYYDQISHKPYKVHYIYQLQKFNTYLTSQPYMN